MIAAALIASGILAALGAGIGALLLILRRQTDTTGANEGYADDLRTAQQTAPSADLRTPAQQLVMDHKALADPINTAVEQHGENILAALRKFCGDDAAMYLTAITDASLDQTAELSRRAINALLAAGHDQLATAGAR